jgi:hypothetical protein
VKAKAMLSTQEERLRDLLIGVEDSIRLLEVAADAESDVGQKLHFQVTLSQMFCTFCAANGVLQNVVEGNVLGYHNGRRAIVSSLR